MIYTQYYVLIIVILGDPNGLYEMDHVSKRNLISKFKHNIFLNIF